jgi:hypothetical protein
MGNPRVIAIDDEQVVLDSIARVLGAAGLGKYAIILAFVAIFQVVSDFGYCRERYKLDLSLMIVVLRKLYEEQAGRLRLATDPVVTLGELREEYRTITGKERDLGIGQYEAILRRLRRLGLIEPLDGHTVDVRNSEARLRLRGSVKMILPVQTAEEMEAWLRKYQATEAQDSD